MITSKPRRLRSRLSDSRFISSSSTINIFGMAVSPSQIDEHELRGRRLYAIQHCQKALAVDWFGDDLNGPQAESLVPLLEHRDHDHRRLFNCRIRFQGGQ